MRLKAIRDLAQLSDKNLFMEVANGLTLVIKNLSRLCTAFETLMAAEQCHASRIIRMVAQEEAAKFLILIDAIRCPRNPSKRFIAHLGKFNDHLAKGLYARACNWRPATLDELQKHLDFFRQELYLDGPNDVDWIYYNDILQERTDVLYVDYVAPDEGHHWSDPSQLENSIRFVPSESEVIKISKALFEVGVASHEGLKIVAEIWRGAAIEPTTHWSEIRRLNIKTLRTLMKRGLLQNESQDMLSLITDMWPFPMYGVDLSIKRVMVDDLRQRQMAWNPEC